MKFTEAFSKSKSLERFFYIKGIDKTYGHRSGKGLCEDIVQICEKLDVPSAINDSRGSPGGSVASYEFDAAFLDGGVVIRAGEYYFWGVKGGWVFGGKAIGLISAMLGIEVSRYWLRSLGLASLNKEALLKEWRLQRKATKSQLQRRLKKVGSLDAYSLEFRLWEASLVTVFGWDYVPSDRVMEIEMRVQAHTIPSITDSHLKPFMKVADWWPWFRRRGANEVITPEMGWPVSWEGGKLIAQSHKYMLTRGPMNFPCDVCFRGNGDHDVVVRGVSKVEPLESTPDHEDLFAYTGRKVVKVAKSGGPKEPVVLDTSDISFLESYANVENKVVLRCSDRNVSRLLKASLLCPIDLFLPSYEQGPIILRGCRYSWCWPGRAKRVQDFGLFFEEATAVR